MTRAPLLVALAACSWVTASSRTAHAGVFLGTEVEGAAGFNLPAGTHVGYGFLGALGYRIGIGPVFLQPEAQAGFTLFPGAFTPPHAARVLGGMRLGYWGAIQPAIFAHAGAGWLGSDANGPALDAGLSLSFKLVPIFVFGAQSAYNVVMVLSESSATRWVSFGLHAGVEL